MSLVLCVVRFLLHLSWSQGIFSQRINEALSLTLVKKLVFSMDQWWTEFKKQE